MTKVVDVSIPQESYLRAIAKHYSDVWAAVPKARALQAGPIHELSPHFCVLEFAPTAKRQMWTYASCGMSNQPDAVKLELHLFSPHQADELVELLTVIAHYHLVGTYLDLGHTVNFGRPWLLGSQCEYGLVSLPYLDGPKLEWLETTTTQVRFLWLVPITLAERDFKKAHGLEALEEQFERKGFHYADPKRSSVV